MLDCRVAATVFENHIPSVESLVQLTDLQDRQNAVPAVKLLYASLKLLKLEPNLSSTGLFKGFQNLLLHKVGCFDSNLLS